MSKVTITAEVELKKAQIGIAADTIQAVNKAADKICKLLPPSRKHQLASSVKEFSESLVHYSYDLGDYVIQWQNHYKGEYGEFEMCYRNGKVIGDGDTVFLRRSEDLRGQSYDRHTHSNVLSSPFVVGHNDVIGGEKRFRTDFTYDSKRLTIEQIRLFVQDVKSGKIVEKLKTAIAVAEAKEAAEVQLYKKMLADRKQEEKDLIADLKVC
jgi:hypothetical protein